MQTENARLKKNQRRKNQMNVNWQKTKTKTKFSPWTQKNINHISLNQTEITQKHGFIKCARVAIYIYLHRTRARAARWLSSFSSNAQSNNEHLNSHKPTTDDGDRSKQNGTERNENSIEKWISQINQHLITLSLRHGMNHVNNTDTLTHTLTWHEAVIFYIIRLWTAPVEF